MSVSGTAGNDFIIGTVGNDVISGLGGDDFIDGALGDDTLNGGDGADNLYGSTGNDSLFGGSGGDFLEGSWGQYTFRGGSGADILYLTFLDQFERTDIGSPVSAPDQVLDFNRAEGDRLTLIGSFYQYPSPAIHISPDNEALPLRWMGSVQTAVASDWW